MNLILWIVISLGIVVITTFCIIMYRSLYSNEQEYVDNTIVENYVTQFTHGYSQGSLIDVIKGDDRIGLIYMPLDVDYMRKSKKGEKIIIKPQVIFSKLENVIPIPRPSLSSDRNLIKVFPENPEDLPIEFRNSKWGKSIMESIAKIKAETTAIDIQRKERDIEDMLLKRTRGRDRFIETLKIDDALWKDHLRSIIDKTDTKNKTNLPYSQQYSSGSV